MKPRTRRVPWRWHAGILVPDPSWRPFVAAVLHEPADETSRLVFADKVEEFDISGASEVAGWLRADGAWVVGGAVGRRHAGLVWYPKDHPRGTGYVAGGVSRLLLPRCGCGTVPAYTTSTMLVVRGGRWVCTLCAWSMEHG